VQQASIGLRGFIGKLPDTDLNLLLGLRKAEDHVALQFPVVFPAVDYRGHAPAVNDTVLPPAVGAYHGEIVVPGPLLENPHEGVVIIEVDGDKPPGLRAIKKLKPINVNLVPRRLAANSPAHLGVEWVQGGAGPESRQAHTSLAHLSQSSLQDFADISLVAVLGWTGHSPDPAYGDPLAAKPVLKGVQDVVTDHLVFQEQAAVLLKIWLLGLLLFLVNLPGRKGIGEAGPQQIELLLTLKRSVY